MSLGTRMQATALRLLTNYGEAVTFTRVTEGAYLASSSTVASSSTTTFTGYGHPSSYSRIEIDGDLVNAEDLSLLVNKVSSVPVPGDVVTLNSINYRVLNVDRVRANGVDIIYRCQLRI